MRTSIIARGLLCLARASSIPCTTFAHTHEVRVAVLKGSSILKKKKNKQVKMFDSVVFFGEKILKYRYPFAAQAQTSLFIVFELHMLLFDR